MPGVYKEKQCPNCGAKHRKKGIYCGQSCAATLREATDNMRDNMRKVAVEYNKTPEAIAQKKLFNTGITIEDFAVDIPELKSLDDYTDIIDGYDNAENW